ncbi:SRPBCC family protein [Rubrimonas cliftonensis]|uniref:MxaD protein n=1 Tax=Rubrimonas cliftonensis TaxID=89524 RepID=A0A1H4FHA6_9RHOB|nr:SRPBCC family protein [Rubrimonas cliftonensis]SEA96665.1 mxaD protein [Rubrimonas cliftonensis]
MIRSLLAAALVALAAAPAAAHGPTPQRMRMEAAIAAEPDRVWPLIAQLAAIGVWHPALADVVVTGGPGRGALRTLTFAAGGAVVEGVDDLDDASRTLRWRLKEPDPAAFPASFYSSDIKVEPAPEGSLVTWSSNFYRADTGNYPDETQDDAAAVAAMEAFVTEGLAGLKTLAESLD